MSDERQPLIEIDDPEIDPAAIMAEIEARIAARRAEEEERPFPSYGVTPCPEEPSDLPHDPNLYFYLRRLNESFAGIDTEPILAPSPATRTPIVGKLWGAIRHEVHALILFYVNRAVAQQVAVNRSTVSIVNELTRQLEAQQRQIRRLERELAERGGEGP